MTQAKFIAEQVIRGFQVQNLFWRQCRQNLLLDWTWVRGKDESRKTLGWADGEEGFGGKVEGQALTSEGRGL